METPISEAFIGGGNVFLAVGNGASPEEFEKYCEITDLADLAEKNDQVDVTTLCSDGVKQYIGGLSDGAEFSWTANFVLNDTIRKGLIADVQHKANRNFRVLIGGDSPQETWQFGAAMLSWTLASPVAGVVSIKFTAKISTPIDMTT